MPKRANGYLASGSEWKLKRFYNIPQEQACKSDGKHWNALSLEDKARYKEASNGEFSGQSRKTVKLACMVDCVTSSDLAKNEKENNERKMKRVMEGIVADSVRKSELSTKHYYFIMANFFLKNSRTGEYIPAEISVAKFSLQDGVVAKYHSLINPGSVTYGGSFEAQEISKTTHRLPIPPNALGATDLVGIFEDILTFIGAREFDHPPLYTRREDIPIVTSVLRYLKAKSSRFCNNALEIYSIEDLMLLLKRVSCNLGEIDQKISILDVNSIFERDYFEYCPGIGCQFHEERDNNKYCTQSYVTRWGYDFARFICLDIAIDLQPGRHKPIEDNSATVKMAPITDTCNVLKKSVPINNGGIQLCSLSSSTSCQSDWNIAKTTYKGQSRNTALLPIQSDFNNGSTNNKRDRKNHKTRGGRGPSDFMTY